MSMTKYPYVEDYIEFIGGYKNPKNSLPIVSAQEDSPLNLARYDVKMIDSLATQSMNGTGYTDRQAPLAVQLVLKYERQLTKNNVDIEPVKLAAKFRLPIRVLDRSTRAWIEDEMIRLRFPYSVELVEELRTAAKQSHGMMQFHRDSKQWRASLTEHNVNLVYSFAEKNKITIDPTLSEVMQLILACEKTAYKIELVADDQLRITNAESSLVEYVEQHLGGFKLDNILTLADRSAELGFTVNNVIADVIIQAYGTRFYSLCINREIKIARESRQSDQVSEIVRYATETKRFPIYIYEPNMSDCISHLFASYFTKEQVVNLNSLTTDYQPGAEDRLVYFNRIPKYSLDRIPLFISTAGMLFGGDKIIWTQASEKIVYFTEEVYSKNNRGREICRLN